MRQDEAKAIIKRLKDIYPDSNLVKNQDFLKEYFAFILSLNFDRASKVIDIVKTKCKFLPTMAEFSESYKGDSRNISRITEVDKDYWCGICRNQGVVKYSKEENELSYDYFAYCTCKLGNEYNIKTKERMTYCVTDILSTDELQSRQAEPKPINTGRINVRSLITELLKGKKIDNNFSLPENCPF